MTKSMLTTSHHSSGVSEGWSSPEGQWCCSFVWLHRLHVLTDIDTNVSKCLWPPVTISRVLKQLACPAMHILRLLHNSTPQISVFGDMNLTFEHKYDEDRKACWTQIGSDRLGWEQINAWINDWVSRWQITVYWIMWLISNISTE
jgi:hypothetical protein